MALKKLTAVEAAIMTGLPYVTFISIVSRGEGPPTYHFGKVRFWIEEEVRAWPVPAYTRRPRPIPDTWKEGYDELVGNMHKSGATKYVMVRHMLDRGMNVSLTDITHALQRLGLVNNTPKRIKQHPTPPKSKESPLAFAEHWLGTRLVKKSKANFLDGTPVDLDEMMKEANKAAIRLGIEPILTSERWKP